MKQEIVHLALLVRDYDEALHFYTQRLGFKVIEDTALPEPGKRWVVVSPPNSLGAGILLAKASNSEQERFVGNQSGGRVFLFLSTDDFWRDYENLKGKGVVFKREPNREAYGTVAVFEDLYGNLWDLIEYSATAA